MDIIVQAASGAMAKTGFPDGPPLRSGITIADHTTATFAALGIVAALRQRDLTGAGQLVDVAMLDVLTALVLDEPVDHYAASGVPVRTGNADARGAPINTYRCADGWVAVTCTSDGQFERLCALMERPELRTRFPDVRARARPAPRARRRDRSVDRDPTGARRSKRRSSASASRGPGARAGRGRGRPGRTAAASLLEELRHPDAPTDGRAGSSARASRSSFDGRVDLPPPSASARAPTRCCASSRGCDDDELARRVATE